MTTLGGEDRPFKKSRVHNPDDGAAVPVKSEDFILLTQAVRFFLEISISPHSGAIATFHVVNTKRRLELACAKKSSNVYVPERADLVIGLDTLKGCIPILPVEFKSGFPDTASMKKLFVQSIHPLLVCHISYGTPAAIMCAGARFSRLFVLLDNVIAVELNLHGSTVKSLEELRTYRSCSERKLPCCLQYVITSGDGLLHAQRFAFHAHQAFQAVRALEDSYERSMSPFHADSAAEGGIDGATYLAYRSEGGDRGQIYTLYGERRSDSESGSRGSSRRGMIQGPCSILPIPRDRRTPSDDEGDHQTGFSGGAAAYYSSVVQSSSPSVQLQADAQDTTSAGGGSTRTHIHRDERASSVNTSSSDDHEFEYDASISETGDSIDSIQELWDRLFDLLQITFYKLCIATSEYADGLSRLV
ncbi:hypothetical protein I317_05135 [Kwoniella heveanensis CBS 569]|nr:hypothetical protein I317_05135 [Kwoniella heveanensis CBS 569]